MPVDNSRLKGFYKLDVEQRREKIAELANLNQEQVTALATNGELDDSAADRMIENVIGTMSLPVGVATNFIIDGKHYVVPFCLEESSVVAAASNMAKRCHVNGGFSSNNDKPIMIAQIQLMDIDDHSNAIQQIVAKKDEIMALANSLPSTMIRLGGGCKDISTHSIETLSGPMLIVHIHVDCRDAMGANAVNTMAELLAPELEKITNGRSLLRILSNLATQRLARVSATFTPEEMSNTGDRGDGESIIQGVLEAHHFAMADPYRAATHNKGVMNGISAVAVACGQDWRAIEAGCHAYVSYNQGRYGSITHWEKDSQGNLVGTIETPMAVGIVGGASKVHPVARTNLQILGVDSAQELASVMAAAGLAQNLGALRALATSGIQKGHMRLHAKNMAVSAGAVGDEIERVAQQLISEEGPKTQTRVAEILEELRS
ncbi:MAG: hydroxymethylglutaryl-CoA reductase, degradative [Euryarchaeota archaeon]|jgi:hydroxymethylglutaryl-CoA reductase|nr:hydroxymethylglutaryl-CoA reductase, degradative [Euryarchaeota archaeon]CAI8388028.1 MAG: 3-hydroxy-3-methylglutaryl-coenzyme A reductase [Euryarchaeota archaeon UBA443]|tara:strand:+ start:297 stop:1592 length:1296 start_codon:yes stop_codon:yes gene_type:complete